MTENQNLREALSELFALVMGECRQLLDEDSGGNSALYMQIQEALALPTTEPLVWRLTASVDPCGLKRFLTQRQYEANPLLHKWYEPVCQQCTTPTASAPAQSASVAGVGEQAQELAKTACQQLRKALNAMLTQFGMDEDEWSAPVFKQAREALAAKPDNPRCEYCDGTGDVIDQTGEWRGACNMCDANQPQPQAQALPDERAVNQIMEQAQVFASAWSLVGGGFDFGNALQDAEDAKTELREMVARAALASKPARFGAQRVETSPDEGWWITKDGVMVLHLGDRFTEEQACQIAEALNDVP